MATDRMNYDDGTYLMQSFPWGIYRGGAALCADGKVRKLARIAQTADTFFSVPAAVKVRGVTVSGFITTDRGHVRFIAYQHGKNANMLPAWETVDA